MAGRRKVLAVLSAVIALLLSGAVAGLARMQEDTVDVSTTSGPEAPSGKAEVAVEVAGTLTVAPAITAAAPAPTSTTTDAPTAASPRTTVKARPK